jgi:uncharacterized YigZ family protein
VSDKVNYFSLVTTTDAELKVKGSKFIADLAPVSSEGAVIQFLEDKRNQHPKAVHHCLAFKLGIPPVVARSSDDGEPSGTAGKPMLGQLDSFYVTNVVAVVTRYFGGTLLGTGGLRKAYKDVVKIALENAELVEVKKQYKITITCDILLFPQVMNAAKRFPGQIQTLSAGLSPYVSILSEDEEIDSQVSKLKSNILGVSPDYAETIIDPGFKISIE